MARQSDDFYTTRFGDVVNAATHEVVAWHPALVDPGVYGDDTPRWIEAQMSETVAPGAGAMGDMWPPETEQREAAAEFARTAPGLPLDPWPWLTDEQHEAKREQIAFERWTS